MKSMIGPLLLAGVTVIGAACADADADPSPANVPAVETPATTSQPVVTTPPAPLELPAVEVLSAPTLDDAGRTTVYSGVYTLDQSERGKEVQEKNCLICHAADEWTGGRLLTNYTGQPMLALVEQIRSTMPLDGPGRLEYEEYVDIAALILRINGMPAGPNELSTEPDALREVRIEYRR